MPRIKITQPSMSSVGLGVEIDGRKIENIVALDYHTEPNFIPKITISTIGASEFDLNAEAIYLDVRPTNVNEAVVILQRELLKHKELYKSYRASIQSAVAENRDKPDDELAENILKRITGEK